jgi:predicted phosphodiesterase
MISRLFTKSNSLIQYVSDLHLEKGFKRNINPKKPYLLLGGDIGMPSSIEYKQFLFEMSNTFDKVFIISGNHEYDFCKNIDEVEQEINDICSAKNNLIYLQKNTHLLCEKNNLYIGGCTFWSKLPKSKFEYHQDHKKWIENLLSENIKNNYVIATHHCPLLQCLNKSFHNYVPNYFASDQTDLVKMNNLVCWIHGHSHINKNFSLYGKWILSNQYGSYKNPLYNYLK